MPSDVPRHVLPIPDRPYAGPTMYDARDPDANTGAENYTNEDGRPVAVVDYYQFVMSDFFNVMRIPIVAGRGFDAIDTTSEGRVVIINETLATRLWNGRDPIGQRLRPNLGASIGTSVNPWTR